MSTLDNLGYKEVTFESDSKILIQAIKYPNSYLRLKTFICDIKGPWRSLKPLFQIVGREANSSADQIVKVASSLSMYFVVLSCCIPSWLRPLIDREKQDMYS